MALGYVCIALPFSYIAGQQTNIQVLVGLIGKLRLQMVIPTVTSGIFFVLWQYERYLRKKTVKREHDRTERLEKKLDGDRTSSGFEE